MTDAKINADLADLPATASSAGVARAPSNFRVSLFVLLVIGGLAGAAGSEVIHRTREVFHVSTARLGMPPHPPAIEREMLLYAIANHALGFGALGLLICGSLGLGLGALLGSTAAAIRGALVGGLLGALLGAAGGAAAYLIYEALVEVTLDALFKAPLIHLPNWLLLAAATAIAAAVVLRRSPRQFFLSALAAGLLTALLYPILALLLFPAANSDRPIPAEMGLRVACFALGGMALGLCAARWLRPVERRFLNGERGA